MATLALTEDGWEVEGSGVDWAHWVKGGKLIYVRGFGPPEDRRIPFRGQGGVTQDELDALADRLIRASQWTSNAPEPTAGRSVLANAGASQPPWLRSRRAYRSRRGSHRACSLAHARGRRLE
jgi:hypothetical protein